MKGLSGYYSSAVGFNENKFTENYIDEFRDFVYDFLEGTYGRLELLNWLEKKDELIRFDIGNFEPETNEIDIYVTRYSDYTYMKITINVTEVHWFDIKKAVNGIFCIVSKNHEFLLEKYYNFNIRL